MGVSDKALGGSMIVVAAFVFVYYTTWAIILPLLDSSNPIHDLFPPREWAVRIPAFLFVIGLSGVSAFIGRTILKEKQKKAQRAKLRAA